MNNIIKLASLATIFTVIVGCGGEQKKAENAAQDANAKITAMENMNKNELKGLGYSNPSEYSMKSTDDSTLLDYKKHLEKYTRLAKETIHIIDHDKVTTKSGISKEDLRAAIMIWRAARQSQLDTINNYLIKKGVLDASGKVTPGSSTASPSKPKEQQKPHRH